MQRNTFIFSITVLLLGLFYIFIPSVPDIHDLTFGYVGPTRHEVSFLFVGDVMLARYVEDMIAENGSEYPFLGLASLRNTHDFVVGNFEAPLSEHHVQTPNNTFSFSVATSSLPDFLNMFDAVSLGNNHILDKEYTGYVFTRDYLTKNGVVPYGGPEVSSSSVAYLEQDGITVALLSVNAVYGFDESAFLSLIREAEASSDMQIVSPHWGDEYASVHNKEQERLAHEFIDAGADAVIGHHSHTIQDVGMYKGVPIFYSLGNFVFDQYFSDETQVGLTVELTIENNDVSYRLIPVSSREYKSSPRLMSYTEQRTVLADIAEKSDERIAETIRHGGRISANDLLASFDFASMMGTQNAYEISK